MYMNHREREEEGERIHTSECLVVELDLGMVLVTKGM
jgi:hypothetical protein